MLDDPPHSEGAIMIHGEKAYLRRERGSAARSSPLRAEDLPDYLGEAERGFLYDEYSRQARESVFTLAPALSALAVGQVIGERLLGRRWELAEIALAGGASLEQVADAMSLEMDEVQAGLSLFVTEFTDIVPAVIGDDEQ